MTDLSGDGDALSGGFVDPARASQAVFRALLAALSEPGTRHSIAPLAAPPAPFPKGMATIALTLCDRDTPVFVDPAFGEEVERWLAFNADVPVVSDRSCARFAFLAAPDLAGLYVGDDVYPDRSATLVAPARFSGNAFALRGPGIPDRRQVALALPAAFADEWGANHALFPRGIDLLLVDGDEAMGLPRSTEVRCTSP